MKTLLPRILGFYLVSLAVVIAIQFSVELIYESAPISPLEVWFVLDWFSLIGFTICVFVNFLYMSSYKHIDTVTWGKLASSTAILHV